MSDSDDDGIDVRLVVAPRDESDDDGDDVAITTSVNTEKRAQSSGCAWCTIATLSIVLIVIGAGGHSVYRQHFATEDVPEVRLGSALTVSRIGSAQFRCTDPWEYACGSYANSSLHATSVMSDAQHHVDVQVANLLTDTDNELLSKIDNFDVAQEFYSRCVASKSTSKLKFDVYWWWDRGLEAYGLSFGRARSNVSRYRYLAVQVSAKYGGDPDADCIMVPQSFCGGQLWSISSRVGATASFDDEMCVLGGNKDLACDTLNAAIDTSQSDNKTNTDDVTVTFGGSTEFCVGEVKRLWPTATSLAWETVYMDLDTISDVEQVFAQARTAIVKRLKKQHQYALSSAVNEVQLHQKYVGPPEVYHTRSDEGHVMLWWEKLLLEKEEFDRTRLYISKSDWDMSSHTINAYYWPHANAVFVTSAISQWMLLGADEAEKIGRLGFLLGHELGHAVHSNVNLLDDPAVRATYAAGELCLIDEYERGSDVTVHEDMADRIAYGVVGVLSSHLSDYHQTYCGITQSSKGNPCHDVSAVHRSFLAAAQMFCATQLIAGWHPSYEPHSSHAVRVKHSILGTGSALAAWDCPVPSETHLCSVVGAPVEY